MAPNTKANCDALITLLEPGKVFLPGSDGYSSSLASYFSPQAVALQPACFVAPQTAQDVAVAVKSLTSEANGGPLDFAIRSGGHLWFPGANNSPDGVTIDLRGLNTIDISPDKASVSVGAGATWDLVYNKLDTIGRSVAGGRVGGVGVGGLTLGGGISYFGPREGWTCNQAMRFEVVLADGSIVEATETERPDLWAALRGAANNFGVVTKIKFRTFQQGLLWYTMTFNHLSVVDQQIAIYADLMSPEKYDVNASYLTGWVYSAKQGLTIALNQLIYTQVDASASASANATPPYYKDVVDLPSMPVAGLDGVVVANMSSLAATAALVQIPQASQYLSSTVTFEPTEAMLKEAYEAFNKSLAHVKNITQVSWVLNLEPLPPQIYEAQGRGGRSLVVCLISAGWSDAAQNQQVYDAARALIDDIAARAKTLGAYDPYIYPNYASPWQDVISSYGAESFAQLRRVRDTYDPKHVFTKQVADEGELIPYFMNAAICLVSSFLTMTMTYPLTVKFEIQPAIINTSSFE
ncbi:putative oxidoreductase [Xylaria venustula]|nr:putative oxidoreductase [Xylaria venustula]